MIDPDLTAVLRRRCLAFAIDFGLVSLLTVLVARSQFEGFPIDPQKWTVDQFDRLVELKDDRFHRMQEFGDNQYVISGSGLLLTLAIGLVLFTILFILLPAITGWSPGKKLLGLRVAGMDGSSAGIGQLITRSFALLVDLLPFIIPGLVGLVQAVPSRHHQRLGDRLARTAVVDAKQLAAQGTATLDVGERLGAGEQPDAPKPADPDAGSTSPPPPSSTIPKAEIAAPGPTIDPISAAASAPPPVSRPVETPEHAPVNPVDGSREKIDAAEFLDDSASNVDKPPKLDAMLAAPPTAADLVEATDNPGQPLEPMLLEEPLEGERLTFDDGSAPKISQPTMEPPASLAGPTTTEPADHVPDGQAIDDRDIDFDLDPEPASEARLAEAARSDNDSDFGRDSMFTAAAKPTDTESSSRSAHPPPAHRREQPVQQPNPEWEPPKAEPAPVWRPDETSDSPGPSTQPLDPAAEPETGTATTQSTDDGPVDPVWSEDWQAWLYWDAKRRRWLRHDVETNQWISIS